MKAMILAAGLGTRLQPLTNDRPKALVEINGRTLLEMCILRLKEYGFDEIIVNVHHFANQIIDFLQSKNNFEIHIAISDETDQLLDTGGGLKKAAWFFDDDKPFILCNVDILTDLNLLELYQHHLQSDALATLAVKNRTTSRVLLFDENDCLSGWKNLKTGETKIVHKFEHYNELAFSGIQALSPQIFNLITENGSFSSIDMYLRLAKYNKIMGYNHNHSEWFDLGSVSAIEKAKPFASKLFD